MTAGPVIVRELREESRRTAVYWLRVAAALALGGVLVFVSWLGTLTGLGPNPTPLLSTHWYESHSGGVIDRVIDLVGFSANLGFEFGPGLPSEHTRWGVMLAELGTGGDQAWRQWLFLLLGACLLGLFGAVWLATWRVRRAWQELPPSPAQEKLKEVFVKPRFWRGLFRSRLRRALNRNPVGWLHQYSAEARLVKWGWCLFVVVVETLLVTQRFRMDINGEVLRVRGGEVQLQQPRVSPAAVRAGGRVLDRAWGRSTSVRCSS